VKSSAKTVAAYLQELPDDRREAVARLRDWIKEAAPDAEESMKHGMPYYELNGPLFAVASQKHHISLYVTETDLVAEFKPRLGRVNLGKSCVRFRRMEDLSWEAVEELVRAAASQRRGQA